MRRPARARPLAAAGLRRDGCPRRADARRRSPAIPLRRHHAAEFEEFRLGLDDFLEVETRGGRLGPGLQRHELRRVPQRAGRRRHRARSPRCAPAAATADGAFEALDATGETLFHLFSLPGHGCQPVDPGRRQRHRRAGCRFRCSAPAWSRRSPTTRSLALEDPDDRNGDGVSGRAAIVTDRGTGERRVGRFGWKAQHATLLAFSADAYRNEMGITNDLFRDEARRRRRRGADARLRSDSRSRRHPPIRGRAGAASTTSRASCASSRRSRAAPATTRRATGEQVFAAIGCAACHVPALTTGREPQSAVRSPAGARSSPICCCTTSATGDGIRQASAEHDEIRTPALWGAAAPPAAAARRLGGDDRRCDPAPRRRSRPRPRRLRSARRRGARRAAALPEHAVARPGPPAIPAAAPRSRTIVLMLFLAGVLAALLLAQTPPAPPQPEPAEVPEVKEEVTVSATRTDRRLQDEPLRVEVIDREEIEEKALMTPGSVAMLLGETTGLRVQTVAPSLGAANVRIQGLRGRYAQLLADGLPLYGAGGDSLNLLQVPPLDLGQVEVIKGAASALVRPGRARRDHQPGVAPGAGGRDRGARQRHLAGGARRHVLDGVHAGRRPRLDAPHRLPRPAAAGPRRGRLVRSAGVRARRRAPAVPGRVGYRRGAVRDRRGHRRAARRRHRAGRAGARRRALRAGSGHVPCRCRRRRAVGLGPAAVRGARGLLAQRPAPHVRRRAWSAARGRRRSAKPP